MTRGPQEPEWIRVARHDYYRRLAWLTRLEARICRTDEGMLWLCHIKRI